MAGETSPSLTKAGRMEPLVNLSIAQDTGNPAWTIVPGQRLAVAVAGIEAFSAVGAGGVYEYF